MAMKRLSYTLILASVLFALPLYARAAKTAFRINDLNWRDPHLFVNFIGCRDITDTQLAGFSFNSQLDTLITFDKDGDGKLDLNYILVFDPLDQTGGATGPFSFVTGECLAPMASTSCWPLTTNSSTYTNQAAGTCLGIIALSTAHVYAPAITQPSGPCFVASLGVWTVNLAGIPVTLSETFAGATYTGNPATGLVNGLIRGFISETDANNTIIPASYPLFGGQPLSQLFPGGDPPGPNVNCASWSDKDTNNGVAGWWVYLNFTATKVPFTDGPTAVRSAPSQLVLDAPHPNPFNPSTEIRYVLPRASRVDVAIYDASGRMVSQLANEDQVQGEHRVRWSGRDARGGTVSSGVYFVRLRSNGETRTQKMVLLK